MEFQEFSKKAIKRIDKQLDLLLAEWRKEVEKIDKKLLPLVDKFIVSCSGGKRIRGVLVVLGYEIAKGQNNSDVIPANAGIQLNKSRSELDPRLRGDDRKQNEEIYKIAAAYEILHSAVLVHDDVIDQNPKRRGQPSLYRAIGRGHYGISQAISLGDAGFFLAMQIISEAKFSSERKIPALELFSKVMLDTALGEILDLEKADPLVVAKLKTAYYTISGPLQLGAALGGGGQKIVRDFRVFGEGLGVAFQIKDDLLDGETDFWGGAEKAKNKAEKDIDQAMKILPEITKDSNMSKLLEQMAEWLVKRNK